MTGTPVGSTPERAETPTTSCGGSFADVLTDALCDGLFDPFGAFRWIDVAFLVREEGRPETTVLVFAETTPGISIVSGHDRYCDDGLCEVRENLELDYPEDFIRAVIEADKQEKDDD